MYGKDGSFVEAHALIDCASSASFISEKLATGLNLQRTKQNAVISGIAGFTQISTHNKSPYLSFLPFLLITRSLMSEK